MKCLPLSVKVLFCIMSTLSHLYSYTSSLGYYLPICYYLRPYNLNVSLVNCIWKKIKRHRKKRKGEYIKNEIEKKKKVRGVGGHVINMSCDLKAFIVKAMPPRLFPFFLFLWRRNKGEDRRLKGNRTESQMAQGVDFSDCTLMWIFMSFSPSQF